MGQNTQSITIAFNHTERDVPYTRIIEHKYFDLNDKQTKTYISKEYPSEYKEGMEPYYPVNNEKNSSLYNEYLELANKEKNVYFKGRLGTSGGLSIAFIYRAIIFTILLIVIIYMFFEKLGAFNQISNNEQ